MSCTRITLDGKTVGFACNRGERRKPCSVPGCGALASCLCDFVLKNGKTCDAPLCHGHGMGDDMNIDYCPPHWKLLETSSAAARGTDQEEDSRPDPVPGPAEATAGFYPAEGGTARGASSATVCESVLPGPASLRGTAEGAARSLIDQRLECMVENCQLIAEVAYEDFLLCVLHDAPATKAILERLELPGAFWLPGGWPAVMPQGELREEHLIRRPAQPWARRTFDDTLVAAVPDGHPPITTCHPDFDLTRR